MSLEHFYSAPNGIEVYTDVPEPGPPYLERTRFSGGVNLSALERNKAALDRYELARLKVYVFNGALHCCPSAWQTLEAELRKAGKRAVHC